MYKNMWINEDGETKVKSETKPTDGRWYAMYAPSRVHGANYMPYDGSNDWARDANRRMADDARGNFETGRR